MKDAKTPQRSAGGPRRRSRRAFACVFAALACFCVLSVLIWWLFAWTNSNAFCGSCHEMDEANATWIRSTHYTNASGMHVDCIDCHLPPTASPLTFASVKAQTGLRDVARHLLGSPYNGAALREKTFASLPDAWCTRCHSELFSPDMGQDAQIAHKVVRFPEPGNERSCVSCHPWVGHDRGEAAPKRIERPPQADEPATKAAAEPAPQSDP